MHLAAGEKPGLVEVTGIIGAAGHGPDQDEKEDGVAQEAYAESNSGS
jgi:hypothetical protein